MRSSLSRSLSIATWTQCVVSLRSPVTVTEPWVSPSMFSSCSAVVKLSLAAPSCLLTDAVRNFLLLPHNKKKCRALPVCEKQIFAVACTGAFADRGTCFHGCGSGMFNAGIFNTHSVQCGVNGQLFFVHHFLSFPSFCCFAAHAGTGCFIYGTVRCS